MFTSEWPARHRRFGFQQLTKALDMIFGQIQCHATTATLNGLLHSFGFQAVRADADSYFDIKSLTRRSDPVVERDLFDLAVLKLESAHAGGTLPQLKVIRVAHRKSRSEAKKKR